MKIRIKPLTLIASVTISVLLTRPPALVGSGACFQVVSHPNKAFTCQCHSNVTGTDGDCDDRSYQEDTHELCMPSGSGYWYCKNNWRDIGWTAICSTKVNWVQWSYCYALSGLLCIASCSIYPTSPGCLSCLMNLSRGCFGCSIRYCAEATRTPLYCNKLAPGSPSGPGCPSTPKP